MRTIKFRGKKEFTNEWLVGSLLSVADEYFIFPEEAPHSYNTYRVNSETVGQFTGLLDKNGKEIYEGDIIVSNKGLKGVITWSCNNASFQIEWSNTKPVCGVFNASIIKDFEIMVVGNIHDNPELLKNND